MGHPHRNGAMSSINKFLAHLRSLLADDNDPDPDGLENGLGDYTLSIIIIVSSIAGIALIAYIIYRYKTWVPRTKRRDSKTSTGPESDQLIPSVAPSSASPGASTVVAPDSASPSNIFTRK